MDYHIRRKSGGKQKSNEITMKQEAQLMLTTPHDAHRGQSGSPNIVPFHMLGIFPFMQ